MAGNTVVAGARRQAAGRKRGQCVAGGGPVTRARERLRLNAVGGKCLSAGGGSKSAVVMGYRWSCVVVR